ncbi:hypothetical protein [Ekhidna sp.]|uniref:hypothetical protein n=1 Tax=Ekhidna sp. TaxID=2608089 RepID=UPI003296FC85
MEISIIIARVICIIYLSIGVGFAFSTSYYNEAFKKIVNDTTYLLLGGWVATALGGVLVHVHNLWVNDWRLLITIISWIILAKGVSLLAFPRFIRAFEGWFTPKGIQNYFLPMVMALGLIFGYYGFFA